jgi:GAF domain-containing protein
MGGDALPIPTIRVGDQATDKATAYASFLEATQAALDHETDTVAAMATVAYLLSRLLPHASWSGFYRTDYIKCDGSLIVGPYVGTSMGCLRIARGKGVCGAAATQRRALVVPDVTAFPGHIACSSATKSELVVPVFEEGDSNAGKVAAVLDLDSEAAAAFDEADARGVEAVCSWLGRAFFPSDSARPAHEDLVD